MAQTVVVLAWLAVLLRARSALRRHARPARRALWLAMLALALGWTLRVPTDYRALDRLTGVPNLAELVGDALALSAGCAIIAMLLFQSTEDATAAARRLWVRLLALVAAVVVMAAAFVQAHTAVDTTSFYPRYGNRAFLLVYAFAYITFLTYAFTDLARLCGRYRKETPKRLLRIGLLLIQLAGAFGLLYVALMAAYLIAVHQAVHFTAYQPISKAVVSILSVFALVGAGLPTVGTRIQRYLADRDLRALWAPLQQATPGIALEPPASAIRETLAGSTLRLYSRVFEIRDGRLALRPYFRRDVAVRARHLARQQNLPAPEQAATVEAATLAAAVDDRLHGRPAPQQPISEPVAPGGADFDSEVSFLRRVARAYRTSPIVRESAHRRDGR